MSAKTANQKLRKILKTSKKSLPFKSKRKNLLRRRKTSSKVAVAELNQQDSDSEQPSCVIYKPEGQFVPLLELVWAEHVTRKALIDTVSDICSLSGTSKELKAEFISTEVND